MINLEVMCVPFGNIRNTYPNLWQRILLFRQDTGSNLWRKTNIFCGLWSRNQCWSSTQVLAFILLHLVSRQTLVNHYWSICVQHSLQGKKAVVPTLPDFPKCTELPASSLYHHLSNTELSSLQVESPFISSRSHPPSTFKSKGRIGVEEVIPCMPNNHLFSESAPKPTVLISYSSSLRILGQIFRYHYLDSLDNEFSGWGAGNSVK